MKNIAFTRIDATVKVGQTVKWVNQDTAPHNVTGGPLQSKTFGNGGSFAFTPRRPRRSATSAGPPGHEGDARPSRPDPAQPEPAGDEHRAFRQPAARGNTPSWMPAS